jgi:hypothetical protein
VLLLLFAAAPVPVLASGEERSSEADDLVIRTDTRWTGGLEGGYWPIRIEVLNKGERRDLTFELTPPGGRQTTGETVRQTISADQNATVRFTLPVPLLGLNFGLLRVFHNGRSLGAHLRNINFPNWFWGGAAPPAMLVVSQTAVECGRYIDAAIAAKTAVAGPGGRGAVSDRMSVADVIPPTSLPESWIGYSALDIVAIAREDLERLDRPVRTALLSWVHTGGNLLVFGVGNGPAALEQLDHLIEANEHAAKSAKWRPADFANRPTFDPTVAVVTPSPTRMSSRPVRAARPIPGKPKNGGIESQALSTKWPQSRDAFFRRDLMLGTVWAFPNDPFPGGGIDWGWFLASLTADRYDWSERTGVSPRLGTEDFFEFLIPGIRGVPIVGFVFLSTLFAIVIGPVNYIVLYRKKMLSMLLLTVPAVAVVTSLLLVGYSMAAHGFAIKSRLRSLTVLDQKSRTAVTTARLSMFAGMAPAGGMRFSPDTAVYTVFPPQGELGATSVDWTETQNLVSGWLPSKTRAQFLTIRHADERSRVDVKTENGKTELGNGLPWDLEAVVVCDDAGRLLWAQGVGANASAVLSEPSEADLLALTELMARNKPAIPQGLSVPSAGSGYVRRGRGYTPISMAHFETSLMERTLRDLRLNLPQKAGLSRRSYLAILRQNPGVETGGLQTVETDGFHALLGYY